MSYLQFLVNLGSFVLNIPWAHSNLFGVNLPIPNSLFNIPWAHSNLFSIPWAHSNLF